MSCGAQGGAWVGTLTYSWAGDYTVGPGTDPRAGCALVRWGLDLCAESQKVFRAAPGKVSMTGSQQ